MKVFIFLIALVITACVPQPKSIHQVDIENNSSETINNLSQVRIGLDILLEEKLDLIRNKSIALVTNHSGLDKNGVPNYKRLMIQKDVKLKIIFSPEHGLFGEAADGEKVNYNGQLNTLPPVASLYGNSRKPKKEQLKGVDVIIGINVQDSLVDRKNLSSAFEILTQVNNFRTIQDMESKREKTDIYIRPDITKYNVLSFDDGDSIIKNGYKAALLKFEDLKRVALRQKPKKASKVDVKSSDVLYIKDIIVTGNKNYPRSYILGKLKIRDYTLITYEDFNYGINNLSATGNFNRVNHQLIPDGDGYRVSIDVIESKSIKNLHDSLQWELIRQNRHL